MGTRPAISGRPPSASPGRTSPRRWCQGPDPPPAASSGSRRWWRRSHRGSSRHPPGSKPPRVIGHRQQHRRMEVAAHAGVRLRHGLRALQHEDALGLVVMGGGALRPASSTCCSRASSTGRSLNLRREYRCADSSAKFISIPAFLLIVSPLYHVPSAVTRKIFCRGLTSVCRAHIILHNKNTAQTYEKEK